MSIGTFLQLTLSEPYKWHSQQERARKAGYHYCGNPTTKQLKHVPEHAWFCFTVLSGMNCMTCLSVLINSVFSSSNASQLVLPSGQQGELCVSLWVFALGRDSFLQTLFIDCSMILFGSRTMLVRCFVYSHPPHYQPSGFIAVIYGLCGTAAKCQLW